jgi:AraC-like DNA-binding protein
MDGETASLDAHEVVPFGPVRQMGMDKFMVSFARCTLQTYGRDMAELELWFDYPEPAYYPAYRDRLPRMRFNMPSNSMRFPARLLAEKLVTSDAVTARLVTQQCERELSLAGQTDDFLESVRAALVDGKGHFLSIDAIAEKLFTSRRTLNRRLQELGVSYRDLVDEIRHREGVRLLEQSPLTVEAIALHLGYNNSNSFNRAFHRWAGISPSAYRAQLPMPAAPQQAVA